MSDKQDLEQTFYTFLKDAQPIAFLASFSMIIAVFAFPNVQFNSIYKYAAIASSMFLISFVFSLISRVAIVREKEENVERSYYTNFTRYGTFFFLSVGFVNLGLIVVEFSNSVQSIKFWIWGWLSLFLGLIILYYRWNPASAILKKKNFRSLDSLLTISAILFAGSNILNGVDNLSRAFFNFKLLAGMFETWHVVFFAISAILVIIFLVSQNKKTKGKIIVSPHDGKIGTILLFGFLAIVYVYMFTVFIPILFPLDGICTADCKINYEKMGFTCLEEGYNDHLCRFISDKAETITIPQGSSFLPNEQNFSPNNVTVVLEVNSAIRWMNADSSSHRIVSDDNLFDSGDVFPNKSYTYKFLKSGEFGFHGNYPWLKGTIIVKNNDQYYEGMPITQITNKPDTTYKIFRNNDHWGNILNYTVVSKDTIELLLSDVDSNVTSKHVMKIDDMIIGNCEKNMNIYKISYLTLKQIQTTPHTSIFFKSVTKDKDTCPIGIVTVVE